MSVTEQRRTAAHTPAPGEAETPAGHSMHATPEVQAPATVSTARVHGAVNSRPRAWLVTQAVVLALPLLSLLVLFVLTWAYTPPAPHSGDALFDALTQDFDRRGSLPWMSGELPQLGRDLGWQNSVDAADSAVAPASTHLAHPTVLDHIDDRLTGDPRYWLLLYDHAHFQAPEQPQTVMNTETLSRQAGFLSLGVKHALHSPELLAKLLTLDCRSAENAGHSAAQAVPPAANALDKQWPIARWAAREQGFAQQAGPTLDGALTQLLLAAPADAAGDYVAARLECERGNRARAIQLITAGNRVTQCSPFAFTGAMFNAQTLQAGGPEAQAIALTTDNPGIHTFANTDPWKELLSRLAYEAARRGDRAQLQELHRFACRLAAQIGPTPTSQRSALELIDIPAAALQVFAPQPLSAAEQRALALLRGKEDQFAAQLKHQNPRTFFLSSPEDQGQFYARVLLGGRDAGMLRMLDYQGRDAQTKQANYTQIDVPAWAELASFDYRTMSFPAADAKLR